LLRAQQRIREYLQEQYPGSQYVPSVDYIDKNLVRKAHVSPRLGDLAPAERSAVNVPAIDATDDMRMVVLDEVEITNDVLTQAVRYEREQQVGGRMAVLGRVVALLVLVLGAAAAYIRADEWTRGYYTCWLRTLALGAVAAGAGAVWFFT